MAAVDLGHAVFSNPTRLNVPLNNSSYVLLSGSTSWVLGAGTGDRGAVSVAVASSAAAGGLKQCAAV